MPINKRMDKEDVGGGVYIHIYVCMYIYIYVCVCVCVDGCTMELLGHKMIKSCHLQQHDGPRGFYAK